MASPNENARREAWKALSRLPGGQRPITIGGRAAKLCTWWHAMAMFGRLAAQQRGEFELASGPYLKVAQRVLNELERLGPAEWGGRSERYRDVVEALRGAALELVAAHENEKRRHAKAPPPTRWEAAVIASLEALGLPRRGAARRDVLVAAGVLLPPQDRAQADRLRRQVEKYGRRRQAHPTRRAAKP